MLLLVVPALLLLTGCTAKTTVNVAVNDTGSGLVQVKLALDADAARQVPNLDQQLRADDLKRVGWKVGELNKTANGGESITIAHDFASVAEANRLLTTLTAGGGAFNNFTVVQKRTATSTSTSFSGTVDLRQGLASFGDDTLASKVGSRLGFDPGTALAVNGTTADAAFPVAITVDLPGSETVTPPTKDGAWTPSYGTATPLTASGNAVRILPVAFLVLGIGCLIALILIAVLFKTHGYVPRHAVDD